MLSLIEAKKLRERLEQDGFVVIKGFAAVDLVDRLRQFCFSAVESSLCSSPQKNAKGGLRHLLTASPTIKSIVSTAPFIDLASSILGPAVQPVYAVYFDKTPEANWNVPWHQDLTIRVRQRKDVPGFEPRPGQDGSTHMIPPTALSEQILSMRIHLDDATRNHGALRVIPGSHRQGRLSDDQIQAIVSTTAPSSCEANTGDVMLMRPLLLHTSSRCEAPTHRRVIHVEYAAFELPGGLEWHG